MHVAFADTSGDGTLHTLASRGGGIRKELHRTVLFGLRYRLNKVVLNGGAGTGYRVGYCSGPTAALSCPQHVARAARAAHVTRTQKTQLLSPSGTCRNSA